jgi:hypothetical protein
LDEFSIDQASSWRLNTHPLLLPIVSKHTEFLIFISLNKSYTCISLAP